MEDDTWQLTQSTHQLCWPLVTTQLKSMQSNHSLIKWGRCCELVFKCRPNASFHQIWTPRLHSIQTHLCTKIYFYGISNHKFNNYKHSISLRETLKQTLSVWTFHCSKQSVLETSCMCLDNLQCVVQKLLKILLINQTDQKHCILNL